MDTSPVGASLHEAPGCWKAWAGVPEGWLKAGSDPFFSNSMVFTLPSGGVGFNREMERERGLSSSWKQQGPWKGQTMKGIKGNFTVFFFIVFFCKKNRPGIVLLKIIPRKVHFWTGVRSLFCTKTSRQAFLLATDTISENILNTVVDGVLWKWFHTAVTKLWGCVHHGCMEAFNKILPEGLKVIDIQQQFLLSSVNICTTLQIFTDITYRYISKGIQPCAILAFKEWLIAAYFPLRWQPAFVSNLLVIIVIFFIFYGFTVSVTDYIWFTCGTETWFPTPE